MRIFNISKNRLTSLWIIGIVLVVTLYFTSGYFLYWAIGTNKLVLGQWLYILITGTQIGTLIMLNIYTIGWHKHNGIPLRKFILILAITILFIVGLSFFTLTPLITLLYLKYAAIYGS